ncbi:Ldh family oxidoreductase [Azospirillum rugosum]|uniref:LDH2 family malate/lactate/ureidoglycolate dehydrogenase n=1 Tax=Azospirillum rugosum TaxID=416170 RepID=A0ABS4SXC1_9PROT|nr:Ldh family oxidoreductase [Azospirillum rugosum]MBP2297209.1 LDH2 family malate/lactate/ureidoglycolate dehydrogenase [Azospirillum rugosum]MDQ0531051.1 LDH2 family malate/lactate/ureidoglycolate dehydrogenase [Azospirillum rugosum]
MESFEDVRIRRPELESFVADLLEKAGARRDGAEATARAVVDASARAFDTHGVRLVPHYVESLVSGRVNGAPDLRFTRQAAAVGHLDADDGLGHLASYRAVEEGVAMARETGIAAVAVARSSHHGATGCYTLAAARQGFAAIGMTHSDAIVVPHDGLKPFNGTNPISFALPVAGEEPMLLDMATSSIPLNRVFLRRATGQPLPPEVAVDKDGAVTTDPHQATALMPLGGTAYGYKGAGLAAMVDILCSAFTGMAHGAALPAFTGTEESQPVSLGHFFIVLRPELFQPLALFDARVAAFLADLRSQPAKPGTRVMAPGDPERDAQADRRANGVPVDLTTWDSLREIAVRHGVAVPTTVPKA